MNSEIAVADMKPDWLVEGLHGFEAKKCISLHSPATLFAQASSERINDGVNVGGNVEPPPFKVVAGVDDESEFFRCNDVTQAFYKFCTAGAAGKDDDHAALRARQAAPMAMANFSESSPLRSVSAGTNSG